MCLILPSFLLYLSLFLQMVHPDGTKRNNDEEGQLRSSTLSVPVQYVRWTLRTLKQIEEKQKEMEGREKEEMLEDEDGPTDDR